MSLLFFGFCFCFAAQDLLDSWLHEKKRDDFNLEVQFKEEKWAQRSKPLEEVAQRGSITENHYGDDLLQSHDWTSVNSYDNSPSLNVMSKT